MALKKVYKHLHYRAFDTTNIQRLSANQIPYNGPKNFNEIVMRIARDMDIHPSIVRKCISYFLEKGLFRKLRHGEKFHLRGIGQFNPWKSTKTRKAKKQKLKKHNVDGTSVYHNRKRRRASVYRALKRKEAREEHLKTGWD